MQLSSDQINQFRQFAETLADAAAAAIMPYFRAPLPVQHKGGKVYDPVTEAYQAAERVMRDLIRSTYPDHGIIGEEHGNLESRSGMTAQLRKAIAWIYKHADKLGIDKDRIYISGHSSGAHLGGVLLTTDWSEFDVPQDVIKGATLISGMYDLKPVRLSARSSYVPFTDDLETAMSTQRHLDRIKTPVILAYGGLETDEFKRQTKDFAKAMQAAGKPVELIFSEFYNHFEMMDDFGNPYGSVSAAALRQAGAK